MSRIGKIPVRIPKGVRVSLSGNEISIKGPKGEVKERIVSGIRVVIDEEEGVIRVEREYEGRRFKAFHGLVRALIANAVKGVTEGFVKELELHGKGYRAQISGKTLTLSLGYSHEVVYEVPEDVNVVVTGGTSIKVEGVNKQKVGQVAAIIRRFRPLYPFLYGGGRNVKGIMYKGEDISHLRPTKGAAK